MSQWQVAGSAPENYEQYLVPAIFGPWAADLISLAAPQPNERVLDVACGTGIVARLSAKYVGTGGRIVGLDINPGMVATARSLAAGFEWLEGSAVAMPLPDGEFDVVLCQQGLQFFPDRLAALREMHRVLVPGGRVALSVWRAIQYSPGFTVLAEALERYVSAEAAGTMRAPFSLPEAEHVRRLVIEAGFRDVMIRPAARTLEFPSSQEFVRRYVSGSPLAGPFAQATEDARKELFDHVDKRLRDYASTEGVAFSIEAHVVAAHT